MLGALADAYGPRKPGLILFSVIALPAMLALWWVTPGDVWLGVVAIIVAATTMEFAAFYHNAMLPSIAARAQRRLHERACLQRRLHRQRRAVHDLARAARRSASLALFDGPFAHERLSGPLSAVWLIVFSLPFVLFTHDRPRFRAFDRRRHPYRACASSGARSSRVSHYRNIATYLVVRAIYADGMSAVFTFLAGYLSGVFGWPTEKIGIYALIVLTVPIFTSFVGGWIDDRIGSKRTIQIGLFIFTIAVLGVDLQRRRTSTCSSSR